MLSSLADKEGAFLAGELVANAHLSFVAARSHGLRGPKPSSAVKFEEGISLSSPSIPETAAIFIGAHSYMNDGGYVRGGTFIGRYTSIGRRVTLGAGEHVRTGLSTAPLLNRGKATSAYTESELEELGFSKSASGPQFTRIGCDVWIGDGAVILAGVSVGHGAIIGANAVVNRDIPPYAIAVGLPARIIKYRFPESVIDALLASAWWEKSPDALRELPLANVFKSLKSFETLEPCALPTFKLREK